MPSMPQNGAKRDESSPPCTRYKPELFFPTTDSGDVARPNAREREALKVCAICPLAARRACLTEALRFGIDAQFGVTGGSTAAQRKAILRGRVVSQLLGVA